MQKNRIVLIHGYSACAEQFSEWKGILVEQAGYDPARVHVCNYQTLTNEVTIRDLAEGLDRALRTDVGLGDREEFDAIVHSTGMLVIRAWLAAYASRRARLKRLIGLAPATFGSPLAHKGRSWLGAIFKGNKKLGPDFMESGRKVLDALELGSRFTWDLAHADLIGREGGQGGLYGRNSDTPYVFVFCGTQGYSGLAAIANSAGSDGTVRLAGCALNSRKIEMDLTVEPGQGKDKASDRWRIAPWTALDIPLIPMDGLDHGTIVSNPSPELVRLVREALAVASSDAFDHWLEDALQSTHDTRQALPQWQQFVVRVIDERGDPVPDYHLQLLKGAKGAGDALDDCEVDVHTYSGDPSLRCFHLDLDTLGLEGLERLQIRMIASSGSELVQYFGYGSERVDPDMQRVVEDGKWDAVIDISPMLHDPRAKFFHPFTTTLVELKINREPQPLIGSTELVKFVSIPV